MNANSSNENNPNIPAFMRPPNNLQFCDETIQTAYTGKNCWPFEPLMAQLCRDIEALIQELRRFNPP